MKWIILGSISIICIAAIVFGIWLIYSPPYKNKKKKKRIPKRKVISPEERKKREQIQETTRNTSEKKRARVRISKREYQRKVRVYKSSKRKRRIALLKNVVGFTLIVAAISILLIIIRTLMVIL